MGASGWLLGARTSEAKRQGTEEGKRIKKVGSEMASLQRPARDPPCNSPLCYPVADQQTFLRASQSASKQQE